MYCNFCKRNGGSVPCGTPSLGVCLWKIIKNVSHQHRHKNKPAPTDPVSCAHKRACALKLIPLTRINLPRCKQPFICECHFIEYDSFSDPSQERIKTSWRCASLTLCEPAKRAQVYSSETRDCNCKFHFQFRNVVRKLIKIKGLKK